MTTVGYIDKKKVANLLGIRPETLRFWMRDRRIAYYRVGHRVLFRPEDVEAFFATCRIEATPQPRPRLGRRRVAQVAQPRPGEPSEPREPHGPPPPLPPEPEEPEEEGGSEEDDPLAALG